LSSLWRGNTIETGLKVSGTPLSHSGLKVGSTPLTLFSGEHTTAESILKVGDEPLCQAEKMGAHC
jgi:hypothetical protein